MPTLMRIYICPYFTGEEKETKHIMCEGLKLRMPKEAEDAYVQRFCAGWDWQNCTIARTMTNYYESEEEKK